MATFEFRNHSLKLTIAGNEFSVECTSDLGDKIAGMQKDCVNLIAELNAWEKTPDDAILFCEGIINDILGDGAFGLIFMDRVPNVTDCSDVLLFVIGEITGFFKKTGNRETRRAAEKHGRK